MSSLAGALDEYPQSHHLKEAPTRTYYSDDIEMNNSAHAINKDDSEDEDEQQDEHMSDLFGNDNDVEVQRHARAPASPTASGPDSEQLPSPEREHRHALEYDEEDEAPPEAVVEVKEAEVSFPNLPVPKSSDGHNWVIRMPNFVKVDTKPFHPDTYVGPDEEEALVGAAAREKANTIKLKVGNMLRWRWTKDATGEDRKESNSRIIRWSDGSLSLRLGKELFDIDQSIDNSGSVVRQSVGSQQPSQSQTQTTSQPTPGTGKTEGLTYLVAQHKRSQVLQSEAIITGYMSLRPTGMSSEVHRMLVRAVEQKHKQVARLKMVNDPSIDPEKEKMEMMKQSARKSRKRTDDNDGLGSGKRRRNYRRSTDHDVMWSDDDEDPAGMYGGGSEEDEDGIGASGSPRKAKRKSGEGKGEEDYQADDFVVPDDSEDDADAGPSRKRQKEDSDAEDDLERMEANLEKQAAAEKKNRGGDTKKSKRRNDDDDNDTEDDGAGAMEVESEEEEDEDFKVRRVTSKRAIAFDDDDE
ncbi:RNA polymerase-associated protein LEO1 [Psilocybe cubensis]|uniref:RNA polymerase-associated protein LEO1 n=2 Tax=Psilocybe cubensis TaxID=181762 RepID=A0A8H7XVL9_PSICU|nr:RNA polymerase-associated protein LEO1 [Psilocybe cubensis]KAH9479487.1 RNA polymerase-associated protein LEO1 [Psilocybe cubensis]